MAEVSGSNAVPLRRTRGARGATVAGPPDDTTSGPSAATWSAPVRAVLGSPRLLWLASLGGTALTVRAARFLWTQLVAEGVATEDWLRDVLRRQPA